MKKYFMSLHIYVSLFFVPLAFLYALTGALYLYGIKQDYGAKIVKYTTVAPADSKDIPKVIEKFLKDNSIKMPNDFTPKKAKGGKISFGGSNYSILAKVKDKDTLVIETKKRTIIGNMIMLHKGKASWYFNVLGYAFAISLLVIYLSGLITTSFCKSRRNKAIATVVFGTLVTIIVGYISVI